MKLGHGQGAKGCTYTLFLPRRVKIELSLLYAQPSPRYGLIFKIAIFETWPLAKVPEAAYTLFLPQGVETELIFTVRAVVSKIRADFQNCHILGMKLDHWPKFQKLHIYSLSIPVGRNRSYFDLWATVKDKAIFDLNYAN